MKIVPPYGTFNWGLLTKSDPRKILAALVHDAWCWRTLRESGHVADLLDEWREWHDRRRHREASWAVSALAKEMAAGGWSWLSYAELERRRRLTSVVDCGGCAGQAELVHPLPIERFEMLPDTSWARCETCAGLEAGAA
jgi:hypothetical protein